MADDQGLTGLQELVLIQQVLIPLFRKMGFEDVDYHHGGVSEKGKDVTMWELDHACSRVNCAVVAKKGKINARAGGSDSAGVVAAQVQQCLGKPFSDKVTGENRPVHRCLIVASGPIDKDARETIVAGLDPDRARHVVFYDGAKLSELVKEHLPQIDALQQLRAAHASLQARASDYKLTATTTNDGVRISFAPKDKSSPERLSFKITLDSSPESEALRKHLAEFYEAGGALTIPKTFLRDLVLPKSMELFGVSADSIAGNFEFRQTPAEIGQFSFRRACDDGQQTILEHIPLVTVQSGASRAMVAYLEQLRAFNLEFTIDLRTGESSFSLSPKIVGYNAKEVFNVLSFAVALSKEGTLEIVHSSTGISLLVGSGKFSEMTFPDGLVELFRDLSTIQEKTKLPLIVTRDLSIDDYRDVQQALLAVTVGQIPLTSFTADVTPSTEIAKNPPAETSGKFVMVSPEDYSVRVFDTAINLGSCEIIAENASMNWNADFTKIRLEPIGDSPVFFNFPRFSGTLYRE